jgi:4-amino-4-deoxy-L-arabinose transferase-like glycosyltransferase
LEDTLTARVRGTRPARTHNARPEQPRRSGTIREKLRDTGFRREVIAFSLLLLVAFGLRIAWLGTIPGNITADEADNLATIFKMQVTGEPGLFGLDWKPQPAMSMYLFSAFMWIFGDDIFGMRMASAVLSTLALLPFYALARRVVHPVAALGGAALLATGLWYLNFSRSGWENVHVALFSLTAAWALTVGLERRHLRWFALAGMAAALGLYGYFAGRLILIALLAYAPLAVWWAKRQRRFVLAGYVVLTLTAVTLFLPQVPSIREDRAVFNRRTDAVYILNQDRPYLGETTDFGIVKAQVARNLKGFFLFDGEGFTNGRYGPKGETLYDPLTGVLLLSGLVLGIYHWRKTGLWWAMLFVPLAGTQIPSIMTPNGARALIAAPFMYLFVALALDAMLNVARGHARRTVLTWIVAGVFLLSLFNVVSYFSWVQSPETIQARKPAIELADYDLWRAAYRSGFAEHGSRFRLREWDTIITVLRQQERMQARFQANQGSHHSGNTYQP